VSFSDPPPQFSQADVDRALRLAQEQGNMLKDLEMVLSRNRDYISKVSG
jgi:COP9 signalosome complex subunit 3